MAAKGYKGDRYPLFSIFGSCSLYLYPPYLLLSLLSSPLRIRADIKRSQKIYRKKLSPNARSRDLVEDSKGETPRRIKEKTVTILKIGDISL